MQHTEKENRLRDFHQCLGNLKELNCNESLQVKVKDLTDLLTLPIAETPLHSTLTSAQSLPQQNQLKPGCLPLTKPPNSLQTRAN